MGDSAVRMHLRRALEAHLNELGYSGSRTKRAGTPVPEIARVSPVRGRLAYGETVLHSDLQRKQCHERLLFFSQRRTRHRSTILFFIGVLESDVAELDTILEQLGIRSAVRGGHVHVVPIAPPSPSRKRAPTRAPRE